MYNGEFGWRTERTFLPVRWRWTSQPSFHILKEIVQYVALHLTFKHLMLHNTHPDDQSRLIHSTGPEGVHGQGMFVGLGEGGGGLGLYRMTGRNRKYTDSE
jgi:hypothetical protein